MDTLGTSVQSENTVLQGFLGRQLGVLGHIDHNSSFGLRPSFFHRLFGPMGFHREELRRRLVATEMGKQISGGCHSLWAYLNPDAFMAFNSKGETVTREVLRRDLEAIVAIRFDHPYAVSAMWNFNAVLSYLGQSDQEQ